MGPAWHHAKPPVSRSPHEFAPENRKNCLILVSFGPIFPHFPTLNPSPSQSQAAAGQPSTLNFIRVHLSEPSLPHTVLRHLPSERWSRFLLSRSRGSCTMSLSGKMKL